MAYEASWNDVVLALRCDGALPIMDDKGNAITNTAVTLSSAVGDSGSTAARLSTGPAGLAIAANPALDLGVDPWTALLTVWIDDAAGYRCYFQSDTPSKLAVFIDGGNLYVSLDIWVAAANSSWSTNAVNCGVVTSNTMYRVMLARSYRRLQVFVEGALVHEFSDDPFWNWPFYIEQIVDEVPIIYELPFDFSGGLVVGNDLFATSYSELAYFDEVYLVKGVALETTPYTPAALFQMADATVYTPSLPIEVELVATYSPALALEVIVGQVVSLAPLPLEVLVVSSGVLDGSEQVSDGVTTAGYWAPLVMVDGVDRSDDLIGDVRVRGARGTARIAQFSLIAEGVVDLPALTGRPVTVDIASPDGSNQMRLFKGVINLPSIDLARRTISVTCTDNLQRIVDSMPRAMLDALIGGRWSPAIFEAGASNWGYAQDRMSTIPASLDISPFGAVRVTPWVAGAVDFHFDGDMILDGSVSVSPAERNGIVNHIDVEFGYRFPRAKREAHHVSYSYLTNGFGPWVDAGNSFLQRNAVTSGIEAAGGAIADIQWVAMPATSILINTGGGGVAVWIPNPTIDPLQCLGFSATVTFDYSQEIDEIHRVVVRSPSSIEALGLLRSSMQGSLVGKTADTLAAETNATLYQLGISHIPPTSAPATVLGKTSAAAMPLTAETDRAAAEAALATLIDVAKVRIISTHLDTTVSAALALHPLIDSDKTVTIDDQGVLATGRVESFEHIMSPGTSAEARTQFSIALCRLDGAGVPDIETPTAAPAGIEDGASGTLADVICTFHGLAGQDQSFEIEFPAVEADQRNGAQVELNSEFTVTLTEDALTIDLGV